MADEVLRPSFIKYHQLRIQGHINRGIRHLAYKALRRLALTYRYLHPHLLAQHVVLDLPIWGSQTTAEELHPLIKGERRFEHLISGASADYRAKREAIAARAYVNRLKVINTKKERL